MGYLPYQLVQDFFHQQYHKVFFDTERTKVIEIKSIWSNLGPSWKGLNFCSSFGLPTKNLRTFQITGNIFHQIWWDVFFCFLFCVCVCFVIHFWGIDFSKKEEGSQRAPWEATFPSFLGVISPIYWWLKSFIFPWVFGVQGLGVF